MGELTAFVTDGDQRPALAVVRSLGRHGIRVIVGADKLRTLTSWSRYAARHVTYPSPYEHPDDFTQSIADLVRSERIDVVMPITDVTTHLLSRHRAALAADTVVAAPPFEAFDCAANKSELLMRAAACGIAVPRTTFVTSAAQLERVLPEVEYPAVIKPQRSRILAPHGWVPTSVRYAESEAELRRLYAETHYLACYPSMIQERIVGPGIGIFLLCDRGERIAAFAHRRLREKPPSGGASVLSESVALDPVLVEEATRLLAPLGWHGVAMIEYKRDLASGRSVLMEVNGRFWGSLQLAIDAGVDFPYMAFELALGRRPTAPVAYKVGVRSRWLLGDLDHLLARLFHRPEEQHLASGAPSRLQACVEFLKPSGRGLQYDVMSRDDPHPAVHEVGEYLADISGSVGRNAARLMNRLTSQPASADATLSHLNQRKRG